MSKKATIIAVVNQKGGTGKTTTTENLGVGLALEGKKVLLVEQSSHKTVFAKVPAMGQIWRDFGHAFSFASRSSRGIYPSPSYLIWMCCTRFPLDLSGAST